MSIRDEELKRLEHYARGLNVRIVYKDYVPHSHDVAEWASDGSEITIWVRKKDPKMFIVMLLIHELSHHLGWIYRGRPGEMKSDKFLAREAAGEQLSKEQRKVLYQEEISDYKYRELIYQEVGIKIPKYRFLADIDLDKYIYRHFYLTGNYPSYKNVKRKHKELLAKHKAG